MLSIRKLLISFRDIIKTHRFLYLKGNILYRDISENNIIITNPKKTDSFIGMLINLDFAKMFSNGHNGARYYTNTIEFIAIKILLGC